MGIKSRKYKRLMIFCIVFRLKHRDRDVKLVDRLWRSYWQGREKTTLRTYESGFNILKRCCEEEKLSIFRLDELARCVVMCRLQETGKGQGTLTQVMAVVTMINEVMGVEEESSKFESKVRKSTVKKMNLVKKRKEKKMPVKGSDIRRLLENMDGQELQLGDRIVAMVYVLAYLGCRRFSDINKIRVGEVTFEGGNIQFYMKSSKTDVRAEGRTFELVNDLMAGKTVGQRLKEYIRCLGLKDGDHLFPKVKGNCLDRKKYLGYAAGFKILENLKRKLSLNPRLTLHSPRVGSATDGARLGVSRSVLMQAGHWNSNVVDRYTQVDSPGVGLSRMLLEAL